MPYHVTVKPSNHTFTVNDGETVLDAALREHFVIAYGCRNGACGTCKGKLLAGKLDYGTYQEHALPDAERETGMALFCQARPLSDLVIECREIAGVKDVQIKMLPCRVQQMQRVAPDVMVLRLKLPTNERLQFLAGQYIDIIKSGSAPQPLDGEPAARRRVAGAASAQLRRAVQPARFQTHEGEGHPAFRRAASALSSCARTARSPSCSLASGTGFAPIKAMIEHALHKSITRPMTLYWGCRLRADLYMNELAERWQREHGVRYVPVLSEAMPEDHWTGRTGFVHRAVMEDFPDLSGHQVYACGAPVMVEAAHKDFTAHCGFRKTSFSPTPLLRRCPRQQRRDE